MKKSVSVALLALFTVVSLSGCNDNKDPKSNEVQVVVRSVKLTDSSGMTPTEDDLNVFDGTTFTLKAVVDADSGNKKVTWSTSNPEVATVVNGVVSFKSVKEATKVTITATSKDDESKKADVTFTVNHSIVDFEASRGNEFDSSRFASEGIISFEPGDNTGIVINDVFDTKWYVQADINITSLSTTDGYPKPGIISTNKKEGWNNTTETEVNYNNMFYCDTVGSQQGSGWNTFGFVSQNLSHTDWDWGKQLTNFNTTDKVQKNTPFTLGMLRDGQDYFLYFLNNSAETTDKIVAYKHVVDKSIPADQKTYAVIGGWAFGAEVSNIQAKSGAEVDSIYGTPTTLAFNKASETLFINDTYQLQTNLDIVDYNPSQLTFESSDETIATVSESGLVTAFEKVGKTTITARYGSLSATIEIEVTDDVNLNVDLDGKMDDGVYSSRVKSNYVRLDLNGANEYINFYGSRNSKGIYLFADYNVNQIKQAGSNWWELDNFELKLRDENGANYNVGNNGQLYASMNNNNFDKAFVSEPVAQDNGQYKITFELFEAYDTLGIDAEGFVGLAVGANPNSGWKQDPNFNGNPDAKAHPYFTKNGFSHHDKYCDETDGHEFSDWTITTTPTCGAKGQKERTCYYCGFKETVELDEDASQHVYVDDGGYVASTCTTHGKKHVKCENCGDEKDVQLPLDMMAHTGTFTDGRYDCCGLTNEVDANGKIVHDHFNGGGWSDDQKGYLTLTGDFHAQITYKNESNYPDNAGFGDICWKTTLPTLRDPDTNDIVVARFDWWGWADDRNGDGAHSVTGNCGNMADSGTLSRKGDWCSQDDAKLIFKDMDVVADYTRVGGDIRIDMTITSVNKPDTTYNYWFASTGATASTIEIGFAAEFARCTISSILVY